MNVEKDVILNEVKEKNVIDGKVLESFYCICRYYKKDKKIINTFITNVIIK